MQLRAYGLAILLGVILWALVILLVLGVFGCIAI